jgi:hypothetical protein
MAPHPTSAPGVAGARRELARDTALSSLTGPILHVRSAVAAEVRREPDDADRKSEQSRRAPSAAPGANHERGGGSLIHHLNQIELSRRWRMSPRTLERWRWLDQGPAYLKIGGRVAYRIEDVEAFEMARLRGPSADGADPVNR